MRLHYFKGCRTPDEAARKRLQLAKQMHPDAGGDARSFQAMQAEYEWLLSPERFQGSPQGPPTQFSGSPQGPPTQTEPQPERPKMTVNDWIQAGMAAITLAETAASMLNKYFPHETPLDRDGV